MTDADLHAAIEGIRSTLADTRDRIDELADQEGVRGVLDPAAGGVTCVIAALHAAQEHLRRPEPVVIDEPEAPTQADVDMAAKVQAARGEDRVVDLMEALERSMAAAKEARSRHPRPVGE